MRTLLRIIKQYNLLPTDETVVVAVSGGNDSLALLHMLRELQRDLQINLHVATFDHGLRQDSARDAEFVHAIAQAWSIPISIGKGELDPVDYGIELAARQARYKFLTQVAHKEGATHIVTAHHADDQIETILMHIVRGTGMKGIQGMAYKTVVPDAPNLTLVRPLLQFHRADLELYCQEHRLTPQEDSTNNELRYTRNYLRHKVIPFLKLINPQFGGALIRLSDVITTDQDYLELIYTERVKPIVSQQGERIYIDREAFKSLHLSLQRRCIYHVTTRLGEKDVEYQHINHAVTIGSTGSVGAQAQFPNSKRLRVDYDYLVIESSDLPMPESYKYLFPDNFDVTMQVPGAMTMPSGKWKIQITYDEPPSHNSILIGLPQDTVRFRGRRLGDRVKVNGKTRTLKKWMIDKKIPKHLRYRIPFIIAEDYLLACLLDDKWVIFDEPDFYGIYRNKYYVTCEELS